MHLDFCEVAIAEDGAVRSAGRVETTPERLELFARSLGAEDLVALEVTGNAWEIARILEPHVKRVIVVSPDDTGIRQARAKTDRLDARALARLLAAGELDAVWMPDERCRVMRRRLARREQLVRSRTRAKNEIDAVLMRRLQGKPPVSDLFGVKGRTWLRELELPLEEAETVESALRHIEFLGQEIAAVERLIARAALGSQDARRLLTVPGVNVICAAEFLAAIGDIRRFRSSRALVALAAAGADPLVKGVQRAGLTDNAPGRLDQRPARRRRPALGFARRGRALSRTDARAGRARDIDTSSARAHPHPNRSPSPAPTRSQPSAPTPHAPNDPRIASVDATPDKTDATEADLRPCETRPRPIRCPKLAPKSHAGPLIFSVPGSRGRAVASGAAGRSSDR